MNPKRWNMTSKRAGAGPADTSAGGQDPAIAWTDFQRVMNQMFDLLEGTHQVDGAPAPARAPGRRGTSGGKR